MCKVFALFFTLCAIQCISGWIVNPLDQSRMNIRFALSNANLQISTSIRTTSFEISMIKSGLNSRLNQIKIEAKLANTPCALKTLTDLDQVWAQFQTIEVCRNNRQYELLKASNMPLLNQLMGSTNVKQQNCRLQADYNQCCIDAAADIDVQVNNIIGNIQEGLKPIVAQSAECVSRTAADLNEAADTVAESWKNC